MSERPQWGPDASTLPVRVRFRHQRPSLIIGQPQFQEQVTERVMSQREYFETVWPLIVAKQLQLVSLEQVRDV